MAFIEIKDLKYSYDSGADDGEKDKGGALKGISFFVERGEMIAVLGHNGSGKSTLAKLLSMVLEASDGEIWIDGKKISADMSDEELLTVRKKVGMVFQNPDDQLVATVVEEDIAFGPENLGVPSEEIRKRVDSALSAVGMSEYRDHAPHRLSGGQKQRIAIAGVLAMEPECIIFDEATAMLDPRGRADVMALVDEIHKKGITVLFITHNMDEAARAERIIVLDSGSIFMEGTPRSVFSRADELRSVGLEVPQSTRLASALARGGMNIRKDPLNEDECADAIISALGV